MAQKIVTFEVAKALKEAGYPQEQASLVYVQEVLLYSSCTQFDDKDIAAPSYLSAWLWIIRKKDINLSPIFWYSDNSWHTPGFIKDRSTDPEEAIIKAINCLVENKLLK